MGRGEFARRGRPLESRPHRGARRTPQRHGAPSADWRTRPRAAPESQRLAGPGRGGFAMRRARRRRRPGRIDHRRAARRAGPRRRRHREGAAPALSHRRIAAAGQRGPLRSARRAHRRSRRSAWRNTASSSSRPTTSTASSSSSARPGTRRCRTPGRCAARSSTRSCSATPPPRARARSRSSACARSRSTTTAPPCEVELDDGARRTWRAKFVVDASGRDTLLANQLRCKEKNKRHNSSALYGHFTGAERLPGKLEGNITIFWFEHGWFWFIPLADGTTSIGAVCWPHYLKTRAEAAGRVLPRHDRDVPGARGAARRRGAGRRSRLRHRQLLVRERAGAAASATS